MNPELAAVGEGRVYLGDQSDRRADVECASRTRREAVNTGKIRRHNGQTAGFGNQSTIFYRDRRYNIKLGPPGKAPGNYCPY
jgi:hypothetical protein